MEIGRNQILVGVVLLAVALLVLVPFLLRTGKSDKVEEVLAQVEAIRQAEIEYNEPFGEFVSAEWAPRAPMHVGPEPVKWTPTDGFRRLSWGPEQDMVHGAFQVTATRDDFKVTGTCDIDGDGVRAVFEATRETPAHAVTEAGVY